MDSLMTKKALRQLANVNHDPNDTNASSMLVDVDQ
jgi:hypothetical protein